MPNNIRELSEKYFSKMVTIRRHLHEHPELSFHEFETTDYIVEHLKELGYEVMRPLETGCVAVLEGGRPSDRVIALRADIDALPILEDGEAKKEFISKNEGVAHCCGHDIHTANLLGTAHILSELKSEITGKVVLIFQAGEERIPGGGRLLCETGLLQKLGVQEIYGLHTYPFLDAGQIGVRTGPFMARPDEFDIVVKGKGGHAAIPHAAIDPVVVAAQIVVNIQTIVSRNIDPTEPAVVTVGRLSGGTIHNVIPDTAIIKGTVRTFRDVTAEYISGRLKAIVEHTALAAGAIGEFTFNQGYPAVINTDWAVENIRINAIRHLGAESVVDLPKPSMAGEDFAFYLKQFPGAFFFLGSGSDEKDARYPWHHPRYNVEEKCMLTGSTLLASLALAERTA
ncbi:MAG TPA: amidohydrolase [Balneolales bacterium]|nr:amidohydrolase [Balneolales bacterium]